VEKIVEVPHTLVIEKPIQKIVTVPKVETKIVENVVEVPKVYLHELSQIVQVPKPVYEDELVDVLVEKAVPKFVEHNVS